MKSGRSLSSYFRAKKVIVTGGSSGIGKAVARSLLGYGADVTIVSDRIDKLQHTAEEFKTEGLYPTIIQCDLAKSEDIARLVDRVATDLGVPDIIINNAGFAVYRTFEQSSLNEIKRLMEVNLLGAMQLTRHFLPEFIRRRSGAIVNMASIAGTMAITPNGTYCAAKHGLVAWSKCLRYELARFNIHVNIICPGRVLTPFFNHETFRSRAARPETGYVVPLPAVVNGTLMAIMKNRSLTYIPHTLGLLSWLNATFPCAIGLIYRRLMLSRIESIYNPKQQ